MKNTLLFNVSYFIFPFRATYNLLTKNIFYTWKSLFHALKFEAIYQIFFPRKIFELLNMNTINVFCHSHFYSCKAESCSSLYNLVVAVGLNFSLMSLDLVIRKLEILHLYKTCYRELNRFVNLECRAVFTTAAERINWL